MKTYLKLLIPLLVVTGLFTEAITPQQAPIDLDRKKIIFIAGGDSHGKGEHEHQGGCRLLAMKLKEGMPNLDVTVLSGWPNELSKLQNADAIVVYGDGGGDHFLNPKLQLLDSILTERTGLVMLHFSLEIPRDAGGSLFHKWIGGYFETDWSVNPLWTARFATLPKHPITSGVKPFEILDEWYYHIRFVNDNTGVTPILQTLPPASTLSGKDGTHSNNPFVRKAVLMDKEPQLLAWAYERPVGGRGFGFTGAHLHKNWKDDNFRKVVLNAIVWTAGLNIPKEGISSATPSDSLLDSLSKKM